MDEELLELQRQFEFAQQAKSSIRLSDRNVVELVQKLQDLHIIDFDLLHTISGKEYITPEQLRDEMVTEVKKLGRISVIDLADITGVDLYYVEKQAQSIVSDFSDFMLVQGEIISHTYWDTVAEEVNDRLQECSQIALAEIAAQLQISSELVTSMLQPRLGTMVKGRMEGGQLYTPVYVARVTAMVRGAARGITVPTNLTALWSSLQQLLHDMNGASGVAVDGSFFQSLFNGLLKEGEIVGALRAGVHWTPTVFANAQRECVDSFFSQNSYISYEALRKLGISQPIQYLQSRYPEGIPLDTIFVHQSMIEMLDTAAEDAIEHGNWFDSLSVLPTTFGVYDASKILSHCSSIQSALKSNKALIFGECYVFSSSFMKDLFERMERLMETSSFSESSGSMPQNDRHFATEPKEMHDLKRFTGSNESKNESSSNKQETEKGLKKKRGKAAANSKNVPVESVPDSQENVPSKSKKSQRKGKDTSSSQVSESKTGSKKEFDKKDNLNVPSEEWVMHKTAALVPDFEEQGMDYPEIILRSLAIYLRPMLHNSWKARRRALLTENADNIKQLLENLQKKLGESFLNLQLYEKALDLFEDDQQSSAILHRHLLRTTATSIADTLLLGLDILNKLKSGVDVEKSQIDPIALAPGERVALAKSLHGHLSAKALELVEALEGKRMEIFMTALSEVAEESGLLLKKLDKKLERTLLHSYRKDLFSQVSVETDAVALLPKVVSLLYVQVHNKALQAPGRAIFTAVSKLKDRLDDSACKILMDYHTATVTLLGLISASTSDEQDCASDRIASKRELLEDLMPALKGLVLTASQSSA